MSDAGWFLAQMADRCPDKRRAVQMRVLVDSGFPLGSILVAFKATEEERAFLEAAPLALKDLPYEDYLRTPHWLRMRQCALERAENHCSVCPSTERLEVHHNTYERLGCERPADLAVLCARHHELFHDRPRAA